MKNKLKGIGNNIIQVSEVQDSRFWIHSFELGYGKWITNKELLDLIESKSNYLDKNPLLKRIIDKMPIPNIKGCGKEFDINAYGYVNCGEVYHNVYTRGDTKRVYCEECRNHDKGEQENNK